MEKLHCFLVLGNLFSISTLHQVICYNFCSAGSGSAFKKLLDPNPHWEEQLDLDPQKINADPQPCFTLIFTLSAGALVPLPGCGGASWCDWPLFSQSYGPRATECDFQAVCEAVGPSRPGDDLEVADDKF